MYRSGHIVTSVLVYVVIAQYCYFNVFNDRLLPVYLLVNVFGALTPDIDIYFRRVIKTISHRNPLTHSALIPIAFSLLVAPYNVYFLNHLYLAFSLGVSSHLISDIPSRKTVNRLSMGWSRVWLLLNGVVALPVFSYGWLYELLSAQLLK